MYQAVTGFGVAAAIATEAVRPTVTTTAQTRSLTGIALRALRPPPGRVDPARARPTRSPRGRALAARRAPTARLHPRARASRSAPAGPALLAPPPCLEGRRRLVTCLCRLAGALLQACDRSCDAEERLVEVAHERRAVTVEKDSDEQPAQQLARRLAQLPGEIGALLRSRTEQSRTAHRPGPRPVSLAERRFERVAKLLAAERLGLEERELPAVEGIAEPHVVVRRAQPNANAARNRRT